MVTDTKPVVHNRGRVASPYLTFLSFLFLYSGVAVDFVCIMTASRATHCAASFEFAPEHFRRSFTYIWGSFLLVVKRGKKGPEKACSVLMPAGPSRKIFEMRSLGTVRCTGVKNEDYRLPVKRYVLALRDSDIPPTK
ncbi:hypothetical protein GQ53DRAFT_293494 [Thozetella sp. PMI_491]|nr:hypothetical protein GQ53DRAFT_293494 [Thozetella sp. PMI_491]